jgi:hypothetical protein
MIMNIIVYCFVTESLVFNNRLVWKSSAKSEQHEKENPLTVSNKRKFKRVINFIVSRCMVEQENKKTDYIIVVIEQKNRNLHYIEVLINHLVLRRWITVFGWFKCMSSAKMTLPWNILVFRWNDAVKKRGSQMIWFKIKSPVCGKHPHCWVL